MKKSIQAICVLGLMCTFGYAQQLSQNTQIRNDLNSLFSEYPRAKVSTGYLLDYAIDLVDLSYYDGTYRPDSCIVDKTLFADILRTIRSAAFKTQNTIRDVSVIMNEFDTGEISNDLNVGIAFFQYNKIKKNAVDDHLINYFASSNKVVYLSGNPHDECTLFAFTPSSHYCFTGNVTFRFSIPYYLRNRIDVSSITFNAGDGSGTRTVSMGSSIQVNYDTAGEKMLFLMIHTTSGEIYYATSRLKVFERPTPMRKVYGRTPGVNVYKRGAMAFDNVRAQVTPYYANGRTSITKPFIIVEGLDLWELKGLWNSGEDSDSLAVELGFTNHDKFYKEYDDWFESNLSDYDIIYVDLFDGTGDISENACLLTEIIEAINEEKAASGSTERNIVMGQSMGGLIARCALCLMEEMGIPHETSVYISHDSPHHGANLPVGVSSFLHKLMSFLAGESTAVVATDAIMNDIDIVKSIRDVYRILHSPAVKQMVNHYVGKDGVVDHTVHDNWQNILNNIGFPQGDENYQIENLCIVNGRQTDYEWFNNRYYLFLNSYVRTSILTDILMGFVGITGIPQFFADYINAESVVNAFSCLGTSRYDLKARIVAHNSSIISDTLSHLSLKYTKRFLWRENYNYDIFNSTTYQANLGEVAYDDFPASKYFLHDQDMPSGGIVIEDDNAFGKYRLRYGITKGFGFIPVASALSIIPPSGEMTASDYERDYYLYPPTPHVETPFDAYFLPDAAQAHIDLTENMLEWLKTQLNLEIYGSLLAKTGTLYFLRGYLGVPNWSTSDESIATINQAGMLTVKKPGNVDVIAQIYDNGKSYYKKKRIMAGFPDMALKYRFLPDLGYIVNALPVVEENESLVDSLVNAGGLRYDWGIKVGENDIQWTTSDSRIFSVGIPETEVNTTVYMKLRSGNDSGTVYSITFHQRLPFSSNYSHAVIDANQNIYFAKSAGGFDPINSASDFAVTYNYVALSPDDNANTSPTVKLKGSNCYLKVPDTNTYITGVKQGLNWTWNFSFFNSAYFLNKLDWVLMGSGGSSGYHQDCNVIVCNSEQEAMQLIPFQIVYDPNK